MSKKTVRQSAAKVAQANIAAQAKSTGISSEEPLGVLSRRSSRELRRLAEKFRVIAEPQAVNDLKDSAGTIAIRAIGKRLLPIAMISGLGKCVENNGYGDIHHHDRFFENLVAQSPSDVQAAGTAMTFGPTTIEDGRPKFTVAVYRSETEANAATCEWLADQIDDALAADAVKTLREEEDEKLEETTQSQSASNPLARHSPDFRSVDWFGTTYSFKLNEAACVKVLWKALLNGTPEVGVRTILTEADSNSDRLIDVFRDKRSENGHHPAWGTMIVQGTTKGTYRLKTPKNCLVATQIQQ